MARKVESRRIEELEALLALHERTAAFLPVYLYAARIENGSIIPEFYSPVAERITGYAREEFLRDAWFWLKIIYPEDRSTVEEALKDGFNREHEVCEYRIIRKDGHVRWVRDQLCVSFDAAGQATGYYGMVEDITERKAMDAQLEQQRVQLAEALESLRSAQDQIVRNERKMAMVQLAGTLMHEINNPLTVVLGYAQMLTRDGATPPSMLPMLKTIEEMSLRIGDILKQLDSLEDSVVEFGGAHILDLRKKDSGRE